VSEAELKYVLGKGDKLYDDEVNEVTLLQHLEDLMMAIKVAVRESLTFLWTTWSTQML